MAVLALAVAAGCDSKKEAVMTSGKRKSIPCQSGFGETRTSYFYMGKCFCHRS